VIFLEPLRKIRMLTTDKGIYQHGKLDRPDPSLGYALEDQARALIVADKFGDKDLRDIYLNFILKARRKDGLLYHFFYDNKDGGFFKNEEYDSKPNTQEAYGLTLWSLLSIKNSNDSNTAGIIKKLIDNAYRWTSPRAMAAALLGMVHLKHMHNLEKHLRDKLHKLYFKNHSDDWVWFENYLTYANAILPWALWESYLKRKCKTSLEIAEKTTEFLIEKCQKNNIPAPIGNRGWYYKGGKKALYDQQPIDSAYMVCCLEKAFQATGKYFYRDWAEKWYRWFFGNNIKGLSLIDKNFACHDGLTPEGVNLNQGAESNICFLMAFLVAGRLGF